jgi:hypothetical protein
MAAKQVIDRYNALTANIARSKGDIDAYIKKRKANITTDEAIRILGDQLDTISAEARHTYDQLRPFVEDFVLDDERFSRGQKYPFLYEVWMGDTYGSKGPDGLLALEEDLRATLEKMQLKVILASALVDHIP